MTDKEMEQAAKAYRDYREQCGYEDPVALDEIEGAYYMGMEKMKELMMKDAIDGMILKNKLFPGNVAGNLPEGNTFKQKDKVKLIIVKQD